MSYKEKIYLAISSLIVLLSSAVYFNSAKIFNSMTPKPSGFIGVISSSKNDVRIRYGDSVSWLPANKDEELFSDSYVFTGEGSDAKLLFVDQSVILLSKNSLVHLNFSSLESKLSNKKNEVGLELISGKVNVKLNEKSMLDKVKVNDSILELDEKSIVRVDIANSGKNVQVSVVEGGVDVRDKRQGRIPVKKGESLGVSEKEKPENKKLSEEELEKLRKAAEADNKRAKEMFKSFKNKRNIAIVLKEIVDYAKSLLFF